MSVTHSIVHQIRSGDGTGGKPSPAIVLLHGYGSDESDLMHIGEMLDSRLTVVTLRAPLRTGFGGFSWFEVQAGGPSFSYDSLSAFENLERLTIFLSGLRANLDLDPGRFILGGFSQGAMMSLGVALRQPDLVSALVLWSGMPIPEFVPAEKDDRLASIPVLIQHGLDDNVLPVTGGRQSSEILRQFGAEVDYKEYRMAHAVSNESLGDAMAWIAEQI